MSLSTSLRGALEEIIDDNVRNLPGLIEMWRNPAARQEYHISNVEDFIYGYTIATIHSQFIAIVQAVERRFPNENEISDSKEIVFRRLDEVRQAIFQKG
jgi:hypothetical protein